MTGGGMTFFELELTIIEKVLFDCFNYGWMS